MIPFLPAYPGRLRLHRGFCFATIYGLVLAIATGLAADARALERFDFEPPYLLDPGHTIKDHSLIEVAGTWHCFYIRGTGNNGTSSETAIGHAISPNLRNWTVLNPAITAGPGAWEARNVWAPHVIGHPDASSWIMFYTGANISVNQRMGLATSATASLSHWNKSLSNPLLWPQGSVYDWSDADTFSSFRDPFFFERDGVYHVLNTAGILDPGVPAGRRGVVHHATSTDLINWTQQPPLAVHNGPGSVAWHDIESVQLIEAQGLWHLFFTETNIQGIRYLQSAQMDAGWDFTQAVNIDTGTAAELQPVGNDSFLFSRHVASLDGFGNQFWSLRVDSLRFDPVTHAPQIVKTDVLAEDWPVRSGTGVLAVPTFGDNSAARGDAPSNPVGTGYLSTTEFYNGPLGGLGAPGIQLGGSATGVLESRTFVVTGDFLCLRVGGGADANCTVSLVDAGAGTILESATGPGTPTMNEVMWDLAPYQGLTVYLRIQDTSTLAGGYINVDHIEEILDPTATPPAAHGVDIARLLPNQPNPFNPRTVLRWSQQAAGSTRLTVFDARGRVVRDFGARWHEAGDHQQTWDGTDDHGNAVSSGTYRIQLGLAGHPVDRRAITLLR